MFKLNQGCQLEFESELELEWNRTIRLIGIGIGIDEASFWELELELESKRATRIGIGIQFGVQWIPIWYKVLGRYVWPATQKQSYPPTTRWWELARYLLDHQALHSSLKRIRQHFHLQRERGSRISSSNRNWNRYWNWYWNWYWNRYVCEVSELESENDPLN